jgi:hypothetical protein
MKTSRTTTSPFILFLVVSLSSSLGCSTNGGPAQEGEGVGTEEFPVTSDQLVEIFRQGSDAVKKRYVGKTLFVRGKIQGIDGAPGQVILAGEEGDPNSVPWISCEPQRASVGEFQLLKLGDVITVKGRGHHVGKNDLFLRDCTLFRKPSK